MDAYEAKQTAEGLAILWLFAKIGLLMFLAIVVCGAVTQLCSSGLAMLLGTKNVNKACGVLLALLAVFSVVSTKGRRKK